VPTLEKRIQVALGDGRADLLIKNGRVVNLFSGEIDRKDVAVFGGYIIGFGDYPAKQIMDLKGDFLCPGLIDGHVHIESSMVAVPEFARAVLPHGTTTVVIDPHEIANVMGIEGVRFMAESAKGIPLNVFVMIPSCVPATHMETSGAVLNADDIRALLKEPWAIGLAEMMNFPGVIYRNPDVLKKIEAAGGKRIDGHAPLLSGKGLYAYLNAGIRSDHECTTLAEAKEKLKNGMWIMIREGTTARNLKDLLPLVTHRNSRRFLFVTDDRHPKELIEEGHIDTLIKGAIRMGLDPVLAIQMATLNAAEYFRLDDLGAIGPGYRADMITFDHLDTFKIKKVFKDGRIVADNGKTTPRSIKPHTTGFKRISRIKNSVRIKRLPQDAFVVRSNRQTANVIQIIPQQVVTKKTVGEVILKDGIAYPNLKDDVLKVVVIERHSAAGSIGIGFVRGFGLKQGAIGSSVAHDSHNLVVVGTNDRAIFKAIEILKKIRGGLVAVSDKGRTASLPLPIAGLMADMSVLKVQKKLISLHNTAKSLGCTLHDPFMTLSFISLPVIPELKITDKGLVDVTQFKIIPLFPEE
jgi:adenine deaminase